MRMFWVWGVSCCFVVGAAAFNTLEPTPGPSESIGSYTNGCLAGAVELPLDSVGFQLVRPSRSRFFAHESTREFMHWYGTQIVESGVDVVLVGDLSEARGGPMPSGHVSHQIGLDIDIWFSRPEYARYRSMTRDERENVTFAYMVEGDESIVRKHWSVDQVNMLRLAAMAPGMERILIHPVIKREICETTPESQRAWMRKLRPWWGHKAHFHVRMRCSQNDPDCVAQAPTPRGDGCDDLDWWFPMPPRSPELNANSLKLPARCADILGIPAAILH